MLLAFIPPGPFGVAVVALLVLIALVTAAVLTASALSGRQDDAVPDAPREQQDREIVSPWR